MHEKQSGGASSRSSTGKSIRSLPRIFKISKRAKAASAVSGPAALAGLTAMAMVSGSGALVTQNLASGPSCAPGMACAAPAGFLSPYFKSQHKAAPPVKLTSDTPPAGQTAWKVGVVPNTSPSIAALPGGGYEMAFQSPAGQLWSVGSAGWSNWNVGVAPGTSPSIAALARGGYEMAFQSPAGQLWSVGSAGWSDWNVGVAPGTSPSIAALPGGGYEMAFQSPAGQLWSVGSAGWADWNVGAAPGTSPSIAALPRGGYEMAFQSPTGQLWSVGSAGWTNWNVGVGRNTDPVIAALNRGGYEMAFQSLGGQLWTVGTAGWSNWGAGMAPGTSPSISAMPGSGYKAAFQGFGGQLWTVGTTGWAALGAVLSPPTSPRIATDSAGGTPIAYQGTDNQLLSIGQTWGVPSGSTGVDISQYQCGNIPGSHYRISVVQVSGGGINRPPNACYPAEAAWAGSDLQTYIYMNGLPNPAPVEAANGPAGACGSNTSCLGYNFGWAWAQHWVAYSNSAGPVSRQWWLDVETGSGWTDPATDGQIIRGALDALRSHGLATGIYSNAHQWSLVTGGLMLPGTALWVSGAGNVSGPGYTATNFCADPSQAFAGGNVKYVQYGYTGTFAGAWSGPASPYDLDYAC